MDQAAQIKAAVAEALAAHAGPLGIGMETWSVVLATFAGPIIAVLATMWLTARASQRDQLSSRRFWIFRTLLATRGQAITQEHVAALNLIGIDYYGFESVMARWRTYIIHLNSGPRDRKFTAAENETFNDVRTDLLAQLLSQISKYLRYEMSEIDLKKGGYTPSGWGQREEQEARLKLAATLMFEGETPLKVVAQQPPPSPAPPLVSG